MSCPTIIWESKHVNKFLKMSMRFVFTSFTLCNIFLIKARDGQSKEEEDIAEL